MGKECKCKYWCDCCKKELPEEELEYILVTHREDLDEGELSLHKQLCKICRAKLRNRLHDISKEMFGHEMSWYDDKYRETI